MFFDLTKLVEKSDDPSVLRAVLDALIGQPCLKLEFSYGGELVLHAGEPVPYSNKKLAEETKGSWRLGTRASHWRLFLHSPPLVIDSDWPKKSWWPEPLLTSTERIGEEQIEKFARQLSGRTLLHAEFAPSPLSGVWGIAIFLYFAGGPNLLIVPSAELDESEEEAVADWELFTPYQTYLRVGPGPVWS